MKRKFLEDMGLSKEQVDNIMAENGRDIEAIKTERDNYKTQLDTAQTTLKSFEGVNVQDLQGKVIKLTADLAAKDAEYQKQIADRDFNDLLKTTVVAKDSAGKTTTVTRTVTVDTTAPVIKSVTINPNPVDCGKTYVISVEVTD